MAEKELDSSRLISFIENPSKGLWSLAVPIIAGMGIQTLYTIVDMIFIGRLGGLSMLQLPLICPSSSLFSGFPLDWEVE